MIPAARIRRLEGDSECIEALAWLAEHGFHYKSGGFTPPLTPKKRATEGTTFCSLLLRIGRGVETRAGAQIRRADIFDGSEAKSIEGSCSEIAAGVASHVFAPKSTGTLYVTTGKSRQVLDVWLDSIGPHLLRLGYSIQPMLSGGAVSWCIVRKGRNKWTLTYFETMTGVSLATGLSIAQDAGFSIGPRKHSAQSLYAATYAVQRTYLSLFGAALCPTVGMIAMNAARTQLETGFRKWRPDPLLVAMERDGAGYRGGMTYAQRWSGPAVQIDITRQYTYQLACELPREWAFGRFPGYQSLSPGVYVCRVRVGRRLPYTLGVWRGEARGFVVDTVPSGEYVCILHTPEIREIIRAGGNVWPSYGFTATSTFSFRHHAARIDEILQRYGRDSALARLSKPIGNYVYGKLGQHPVRKELLYTDKDMRPDWYPYFDEYGKEWSSVWERTTEKYTASQHVDIAGYITSLARAQVQETWLQLSLSGSRIIRCHTDSLTVDHLPESFRLTNGDELGGWRIERGSSEVIIAGPNAYFDSEGAHIAGVTRASRAQVAAMYESGAVSIEQDIRTPRRGFERGAERVTRELRATAR